MPARIADAHLIISVGRSVKDEARILAEAGAAVVVAVVERDDGQAVRRELRARRMERHFIHHFAQRVVGRRRAEVAETLTITGEELAVVVGVFRQLVDAHQLLAD